MSVIKPEIDDLLSKVDSKYTLCIMASRRARQVNDLNHLLQDQALLAMSPAEVAEMRSGNAKPLTLALEEVARGTVSFERPKDSYK
ncbi:MAG: DNA-directed RNA polymerase subunit omega [Coriobacteriia bacterium]|nr:DNA-directed RNA polymerase subunit omega [Coriobacteriia bacterium]